MLSKCRVVFRLMLVVVINVVIFSSANAAYKKNPRSLGEYGSWHAYETRENGKKVCYMVSLAQKSEGKYKKRGAVYSVITHRPGIKSKNVLSIHAGYPFRKNAEVKVTIKSKKKNKKFNLFTEGETAWCSDDKTDNAITEQITKKGFDNDR